MSAPRSASRPSPSGPSMSQPLGPGTSSNRSVTHSARASPSRSAVSSSKRRSSRRPSQRTSTGASANGLERREEHGDVVVGGGYRVRLVRSPVEEQGEREGVPRPDQGAVAVD